MKKLKKGISLVLAGILLFGSIVPTFATVKDTQNTNTSETLATDVYFNQDSSFTVTIPKLITLDNSKISDYLVTVTGDISSDEVVIVEPEETFKMFDLATTGTAKVPVTADVSQDKIYWRFSEFDTLGNGIITASNLSAGDWKGSFWFNINLQSNYIGVNAKNEAGEDIHASATNIIGEEKENLLNSLEESGLIESKEEVDALINVKSDNFEGLAETIFDVSNIAQEGDKVAILHFDEEKQEWELIGIEIVDENGKITGNFTSYSPVVFVKIDENGELEHVHNYIESITESTCIKEGMKTFTCGCGDFYTQTIPITEHSLNAGECTNCNYSVAGLYDADGVMLCSYEESGIDADKNYNNAGGDDVDWYRNSTTSGYYVLKNLYPTATKVVLPNTVQKIGDYAFTLCENLTIISIPETVQSIGKMAFSNTGLTSITIPNNVETIGDSAFNYCKKLTTITIPTSVTRIGDSAFNYCENLMGITIPASVTTIGKAAFYYCKNLTSISVLEGNPSYDSRNNCNAIIETATNTLIVGCKNTIIPASVTTIGETAFYSCSGLKNITIPTSVTSIEKQAFAYSGLTSITIPASVTTIGDYAFNACGGITTITIPESVKSIGNYAFTGCYLTNIIYKNTTYTDVSKLTTTLKNNGVTVGTNPFSIYTFTD